jgi:hypothetical protein
VLVKKLILNHAQAIVRPPQVQVTFLLRGIEAAGGAAGSAGSSAAAWTEIGCSGPGNTGPGGGPGGTGSSGSACAAGADSVNAASAPIAPLVIDSAHTLSDFLTDSPLPLVTVLLGYSALVPRLLHLCNV